MNRRQKAVVVEIVTVLVVTLVAVVAMFNFKDYINRSEAIQAMQQLSQVVLSYKRTNGIVPPKPFVDTRLRDLKGGARLGNLQYRGLWVGFEADPNEILAYAEKNYEKNYLSSLLSDGYIVLLLDGSVKWMDKEEFEELLARQQSETEKEMTRP